ncbi:MAG: hypothetical protein ACREYF_22065 [Gammaproteobacteria bacterium]
MGYMGAQHGVERVVRRLRPGDKLRTDGGQAQEIGSQPNHACSDLPGRMENVISLSLC